MQHVVYHVVHRDSSAVRFDRVEIAFILPSFYWLSPELMKEGRKPEYLEKTPDSFRKHYILKPEDLSPNRDSNLHSSIGDRVGKLMCC